jgi:MFS family permease
MGLGAAASEPGTLSVLRHIYKDERGRARAVGIWAAVSGLALAMGPVVGGIIIGLWNWRGIFWFNLAFGLAALLIAALVVPESSDPHAHRVDIAGTLLGAAALGTLVSAIIDAETDGYANPAVIALLGIAVVTGAAFIWWERRAPVPLLDLKFFRIPQFAIPNVVAFCSYFATFAIFFFVALYLIEVVSASGYKIALVFLPLTILMIAASVVTGRVIPRTGVRATITVGLLFYAAGLLLTNAFISPNPGYAGLIISLALVGIGIGVTVVPVTTSVLSAVPAARSGMAASAANTSREIGAVTGVAILGALVTSQLVAGVKTTLAAIGASQFLPFVINGIETGQTPTPAQLAIPGAKAVFGAAYGAFGTGVHWALYLSAGLVLLATALTFVFLRDDAPVTAPAEPVASAAASADSSAEPAALLHQAHGVKHGEAPVSPARLARSTMIERGRTANWSPAEREGAESAVTAWSKLSTSASHSCGTSRTVGMANETGFHHPLTMTRKSSSHSGSPDRDWSGSSVPSR